MSLPVDTEVTAERHLRTTFGEPEPEPPPEYRPPPSALLNGDRWPVGIRWGDLGAAALEDPPVADLLPVAGADAGLLYSDRVCWIAGAPGCGKTWIALQAAVEAVTAGLRVLWLDSEDAPATLAQRLYAVGAGDLTRAPDLLRWIQSEEWRTANDLERAAAVAWTGGGLVVIDAASSSGAGQSDESFTEWREVHLLPGPHGVIVCDHVPKRVVDSDGYRLRGPIGSVSKLAAVSGSSLYLVGAAWTANIPGSVTVILDKDRPSGLGSLGRVGEPVAVIAGRVHDDGVLRLEVRPHGGQGASEAAEPTTERVLAIVTADPGINASAIEREMAGYNRKAVRAAIDMLTRQGKIARQSGPRGSVQHYAIETLSDLAAPLDLAVATARSE